MSQLSRVQLACDPDYATYTEDGLARKFARLLPRDRGRGRIPAMVPPTVLTLLAADRVARNRADGRYDVSGGRCGRLLEAVRHGALQENGPTR